LLTKAFTDRRLLGETLMQHFFSSIFLLPFSPLQYILYFIKRKSIFAAAIWDLCEVRMIGKDMSSKHGGTEHPPSSRQVKRFDRLTRRRKPIPPKLYKIGEVVEYSGMSRQTIHNYTIMGLLPETRWTRGGHRLYDQAVFGRLDRIVQLKAQRKSMEYIRKFFAKIDNQG